jgi:Ca2+-transporting ATPase
MDRFGKNELPSRKARYLIRVLLSELRDPILLLLLVSGTATIILGAIAQNNVDISNGVGIFTAATVVLSFAAGQNYSGEKRFEALSKRRDERPFVVIRGKHATEAPPQGGRSRWRASIRDRRANHGSHYESQQAQIPMQDLVVGDILVLHAGMILPVDALLLDTSVLCDESTLTGESHDVEKRPGDVEGDASFLYGGTAVVKGSGKALVISTGEESTAGRLLHGLLSVRQPETPLQTATRGLAKRVTVFAVTVGILVFIVFGVLYGLKLRRDGGQPSADEVLRKLLSHFVFAAALTVMSIPEGMPLALVISLGFAATRLAKEKVLVRELSACETMGGVTTIVTDKTGTLTENQLSVTRIWIDGGWTGHDTTNVSPLISEYSRSSSSARMLKRAILYNSDVMTETQAEHLGSEMPATPIYESKRDQDPIMDMTSAMRRHNKTASALTQPLLPRRARDAVLTSESVRIELQQAEPDYLLGNQIDAALHRLVQDLIDDPGNNKPSTLRRWDFTSDRKAMSTIARSAKMECLFVTKGAVELILPRVTSYFAHHKDARTAFNSCELLALQDEIDSLACRDGLRFIAIACKSITEDDPICFAEGHTADLSVSSLSLIAVIGMKDKVRQGVPDSLGYARSNGIRIIMCTGDAQETAVHVARECRLLEPPVSSPAADEAQPSINNIPTGAHSGQAFREANDDTRGEWLDNLNIIFRATPNDKLLLVQLLEARGEIVAVTGDGTNDAPALRAAHIGCAMGIMGTDMARQAAKLVLLDDSFRSIVTAIRWGRSVRANIECFVAFQITMNLAALAITLISMIQSGMEADLESLPISPLEMLWVNLVCDSLAALALATHPPDEALMAAGVPTLQTTLLHTRMRIFVFVHMLLLTFFVILLRLTRLGELLGDDETERKTAVFNSFLITALLILIQAFRLRGTSMGKRATGNQWEDESIGGSRPNNKWGKFRSAFINALPQWPWVGLPRTSTFWSIWIGMFVGQIFIVEFGGSYFQTSRLSISTWLRCVGVAIFAVIPGIVMTPLITAFVAFFAQSKTKGQCMQYIFRRCHRSSYNVNEISDASSPGIPTQIALVGNGFHIDGHVRLHRQQRHVQLHWGRRRYRGRFISPALRGSVATSSSMLAPSDE